MSPPAEPNSATPTSAAVPSQKPRYNFFGVVQGYLEDAARVADIPPYVSTLLSQPQNELIVNFPVRMDDGTIRLFKGYRIQHNNLLGPFKGGMRFHKTVSLDDLKALAAMMTWKCALLNLPLGGGKGGIKFDPNEVSRDELQRITRRFIHALGLNIGPETDIPAPDVGTDARTMAWAMDTYVHTVGRLSQQAVKGVVTGKPIASGGTVGREKATGQGVVHCITEWAAEKDFDLGGATLMVQGFGNVGSNTAVLLSKLGVSTIAVGDHTGYMVNLEGFNPHKLQEHVKKHHSIMGYPGGQPISREEFFRVKADLFVPAALENQVGAEEANALTVRLVAEGANGPCSPEGERVLMERGVDLLPDILVNSGGVTVSYYEWVQNKRSESWTLDEVDGRLEKAMKKAYREVVEMARQRKCALRIAAYVIALQRLATAYAERDLFP
jgi:glutamate dehydrogenase (NAD(P)+)